MSAKPSLMGVRFMDKKKAKVLSFVGGIVFMSVIAGVLLCKNEKIRIELEEQIDSFLQSGKELAHQLEHVVGRLWKTATSHINAIEASTIKIEPSLRWTDGYNLLWVPVEARLKEHASR